MYVKSVLITDTAQDAGVIIGGALVQEPAKEKGHKKEDGMGMKANMNLVM